MESFGLFHDKCNVSEKERKWDGFLTFFPPKKAPDLDNMVVEEWCKIPQWNGVV